MADATKIEWADATFNPWVGCTKVSPACDHCYAEGWAKRSGMVEWGNHPRRLTSDANWSKPLKWNKAARAEGKRRRVFCASLADVFDNQIPDEWRDRLWLVIKECRDLDWLLLTKRPQNIKRMLPSVVFTGEPWGDGWPHVWLGTTTENQEEFDRRYPDLAAIPARRRFISYEPALGPLSIARADPKPSWVICGGESGPGARPMHPDWARALRDQCQAAGVPFFFKQWGEFAPVGYPDGVSDPAQHLWIKAGKAAAGRILDDKIWAEFPA